MQTLMIRVIGDMPLRAILEIECAEYNENSKKNNIAHKTYNTSRKTERKINSGSKYKVKKSLKMKGYTLIEKRRKR